MPGPSFFINGPVDSDIDAAVQLARKWAMWVTDPAETVDGVDYSAKQQALWAQQSAQDAADAQAAAEAARDATLAAKTTVPYVMALSDPASSPALNATQAIFSLMAGTVKKLHAGLLTPQTSGGQCVVQFKVNATVIGSVTIPNAQYTAELAVNVNFNANDVITAICTQVGAGGMGLRASLLTQV